MNAYSGSATKKLDFIPYGKQRITDDDIKAVVRALRGEYITQGPVGHHFEERISNFVGSKYAVTTNSATSALHIACMALGLGRGDIVWTSPITFVASANCALFCGAEVDFVDIDQMTGLICIQSLENKLAVAKKNNKLPKIVIPVHLCGTSCDMESIGRLSSQYGFYVVEDASHALGGRYLDDPIGCCKYSDVSVFSFHPVKMITTGEGGAACTNHMQIAETMAELRSHGVTKDCDKFVFKDEGSWYYEMQRLGYNYRLSDIQAALGLSQLKRLKSIVSERARLFEVYNSYLNSDQVHMLRIPNNVISSHHIAVARLIGTKKVQHKKIFDELRNDGIWVQLHYSPVHLQPFYRGIGFNEGDFPNAEKYSKQAITLPLYPELKKEEQNYVIKRLIRHIEHYKD